MDSEINLNVSFPHILSFRSLVQLTVRSRCISSFFIQLNPSSLFFTNLVSLLTFKCRYVECDHVPERMENAWVVASNQYREDTARVGRQTFRLTACTHNLSHILPA